MAEPTKRTNALLLAALIVAATVGGMVWLGQSGGDEGEDAPAEETATDVIEIEPMVPRARIASASWRSGENRANTTPTGDEPVSLIGSVEWENLGTDEESRKKNEESLRKAMEKVQGLGVVVAEEEDED